MCLLLLCPTSLYACGLCVTAWAPAQGCCSYRSGRWCFSLGACVFVLLFGFTALLTLAGLVAAFMATRCGCALAADLKQAGVAAVLRYLVQLVQINTEDDSVASKLLTAVSSDYLLNIVKRFGSCDSEPRSAYRLVGEPFVRNASKAIGYEKQLSFLWDGFDQKQLNAKLQFINGGSLGSIVNLSALSALATTMEPLRQFKLQALKVEEIETKVEDISTKGEYAEELKTALDAMARQMTAQTALSSELTDALQDVDKIITDLIDCDLKKKVLQDSLKKMKSLMKVDSKPVDVFKSEAIMAIGDTKKLQDAIDKVNLQVQPYQQNIASVVQYYSEYVVNQMKDTIANCAPAYTMYLSSVSVICDGVVKPFSGFWFCVASFLAVGMVAMFMALCMSTLYSRKPRPPKPRPPEPKPQRTKLFESFAVSVMPKETPLPREPSTTEVQERVPKREKTRKSSISESESSASSCRSKQKKKQTQEHITSSGSTKESSIAEREK
ncbi:uncharacterized protein LOC125944393 [Dermacentor silvarum]|uniref:uncharacterized protein LOC125944393 n=1 Tax=Dermacentor silvarum TaxID=543639 RepID=UPI0021006E59|nr:uncharacterized protein LOC125944393 [Dermacentor silvarum]